MKKIQLILLCMMACLPASKVTFAAGSLVAIKAVSKPLVVPKSTLSAVTTTGTGSTDTLSSGSGPGDTLEGGRGDSKLTRRRLKK